MLRASVFLLGFGHLLAQCPQFAQEWNNPPVCSCSSTRYEAVSIVCDRASSLQGALRIITESNVNIDSLLISNTPINEIHDFAFQNFKIKKLQLRNCGLRDIRTHAFTGSLESTLEELEIRGGYLDTIPQTGLTKLRNLKALSLSDNIIDYVADNSFLSYYSRETIERLDLSSNNMTSIHPTGLLGLENLHQLSLDKNLFREIPTEALANVPTLEDLSLGINLITTVPQESLPLPNLKSLSLEVNQIRSLPADSFQSTPRLTYLYLGNNLLTAIDASTFFYINNLKVLSMSNNKDITSVTANSLQNLPQLLRLELSDCSIANIEPGAFRRTNKLQVIVLSHNQITHIGHDVFSSMPSIALIDLSDNSITHMEDFSFSQLPNLGTLDLSGNRLESLPQNVLYESMLNAGQQSRSLLLSNNPWRCDKNLLWLRAWLRSNGDITISKGGLEARCWSPSPVNGIDLRQTDPVVDTINEVPVNQMRRLVQQFHHSTPPTMEAVVTKEPPRIASANILGLILACVVGILAVCVILLLLIRYFAKGRHEKEANVSSVSSSTVSSGTFENSSYNDTRILPNRAYGSSTNHNVYLNKPRYWWF